MTKRSLLWSGLGVGLVLLLGGEAGHLMGAQGRILADALSCSGSLTVDKTSGTLSTQAGATTLHISASGLDNTSQVYLQILDANNRSGPITPLTSVSTDGSGTYGTSASPMAIQLPYTGVAGGSDTIVVADNGPKCAKASFTVLPAITLFPSQGYAFSFTGSGFPAGGTLTATFVDSKGTSNPVSAYGAAADYLGRAGGSYIAIPSTAATGQGTIQIGDSQNHTASAAFTFTGAPPTPVPGYNPPVAPSMVIVPFPGLTPIVIYPTYTPPPGYYNTPVSTAPPTTTVLVPFPTATATRIGSFNPQASPTTGGVGFPTPTYTPFLIATAPPRTTTTVGHSFPTPTGGQGGNPACRVAHGLSDGTFQQQLTCWTASPSTQVAIDRSVKYAGTAAARLTAPANSTTMLSQSFAYDRTTQSVVLFYQSHAGMSTAQVIGHGMVLVGQRLPATKGKTFSRAVLALPAGLRAGDTLTLMIASRNGATYVAEIGVSASPTGAPPKPAAKPSPTPTPKPGKKAATPTPKPKKK